MQKLNLDNKTILVTGHAGSLRRLSTRHFADNDIGADARVHRRIHLSLAL